MARNIFLSGLEKDYFSYKIKNVGLCFILQKLKDPYSLFGSDIRYLFWSKSKISILINDWKTIIAYWEESKQGRVFTGNCDSLHIVNNWWDWEKAAKLQENFAIQIFIYIWKQLLNSHFGWEIHVLLDESPK